MGMFRFVPLLLLFVCFERSNALTVLNGTSVPAGKAGKNTTVFEYAVSDGKNVNRKRLLKVNADEKDPKRIVWVFPGYKPSGDPYLQDPEFFVKKWDMEKTALKYRLVFYIPDMADGLYRLTPKKSPEVSDIQWLKEAYQFYNGAVPVSNVLLVGISTGAEGALKFASLLENPPPVVAVSGTCDLFTLPEDGAEYALHRRTFGMDQNLWTNENPLSLLQKNHPKIIYLFCEERSVYALQAAELGSAGIPGMAVSNYLFLGKGMRHDWDFWGNPRVVKAMMSIIEKN